MPVTMARLVVLLPKIVPVIIRRAPAMQRVILTVKTTEKANETTFQSNKSATSYDGGVSDGSNATKRP